MHIQINYRGLNIAIHPIFVSPYILESVPFLGGPEDLMLHEGDSGQLTCTGSNVSCLTEVIHTYQ